MSEEFNSLETPNDEQSGAVDRLGSSSDFDIVEINPESPESQPDAVDQDVVETEEAEEVAPRKQTREDNHAAKAARLKAERDAKAEIEKAKKEAYAELESKLRASGVKNPYTEKEFESFDEFFDYGKKIIEAEQQERADEEGKTLEEIQQEDADKEYLARKRQEDSDKAKKEKDEAERKEFVNKDLADFTEKYPEVDISGVLTNESFKKFAGSRLGNEPLAELYADFSELVGTAENNGRAKAQRNNRSTGSGDTGGDRMTAAQRRSLEEWNSAFPEMQMTPSEFLRR